ncbi:hypothetical protein K1W54_38105, partial [Micromonospora sp. CPCC 205371]|nr:hypothetical protein [Micromonospora sp. CPCC 205371]
VAPARGITPAPSSLYPPPAPPPGGRSGPVPTTPPRPPNLTKGYTVMHDLIAELTGYRNELASANRDGKKDRAAAVAEQIDRVTGDLVTRVDELLADAAEYDAAGQDIRAGQARAAARRFAAALPAEQRPESVRALSPTHPGAAPGADHAADATPRETTGPKRRGRPDA